MGVASGYVALLGGAPRTRKDGREEPELDKPALTLAFMALTDGNVIDACFGVQPGIRNSEARSVRCAQSAKDLISDAVHANSKIRRVAVQAYSDAFQVAIGHSKELEELNCLTKCSSSGKIFRESEYKLQEAFGPLKSAIASA